MKRVIPVIFMVLMSAVSGCAARERIAPRADSHSVRRERVSVFVIRAGTRGRIATVYYYSNGERVFAYRYYDGEVRRQLGQFNGQFLRASATLMFGTTECTIYLDEGNIVRSFSLYRRLERFHDYFNCTDSEDIGRRCDGMQEYWSRIYSRLDLGWRVRRALGAR